MRKILLLFITLTCGLMLIPSVTMLFGKNTDISAQKIDEPTFKVLDINTGKVETVGYKDYVIGAVMAEMPSGYHIEALKAQAVAAFTYALRQQQNEDISPTESLCGADFSNDSAHYQAYFSKNQAKEKFGSTYDDAYSKISEAVNSVYGQYLEYQNEPIAAAYHSISNGITESAKTVWGEDISYLKPKTSEYDTTSPDYEYTVSFTPDELKNKFCEYDSTITFSDNPEEWIAVESVSDSGTVTAVKVGSATLTGTQFRAALTLRSACFSVAFLDNTFSITTKGYGHGVGLSQYGANGMAFSGYTYDQILKFYYDGVEIKTLSLG